MSGENNFGFGIEDPTIHVFCLCLESHVKLSADWQELTTCVWIWMVKQELLCNNYCNSKGKIGVAYTIPPQESLIWTNLYRAWNILKKTIQPRSSSGQSIGLAPAAAVAAPYQTHFAMTTSDPQDLSRPFSESRFSLHGGYDGPWWTN